MTVKGSGERLVRDDQESLRSLRLLMVSVVTVECRQQL